MHCALLADLGAAGAGWLAYELRERSGYERDAGAGWTDAAPKPAAPAPTRTLAWRYPTMTKPPDAPTVTSTAWALALPTSPWGSTTFGSALEQKSPPNAGGTDPQLALACANDGPVPLTRWPGAHRRRHPARTRLVMTVYGSMLSETRHWLRPGSPKSPITVMTFGGGSPNASMSRETARSHPEPWCGVVVHPAPALDSAVMMDRGFRASRRPGRGSRTQAHIKAAIHGIVSLKHGSPARRTGARCLARSVISERAHRAR